MPTLTSPYKSPSRRSHSPAAPRPPPKAIDLNSSTRSTDQSTGTKVTKRAFFCDVVVERQGDETSSLLSGLGEPFAGPSRLHGAPSDYRNGPESERPQMTATDWTPDRAEDMDKKLLALIDELVRTERSYLARIRALKLSYADPLRAFARNADSRIIPVYEAKTLFANIDEILAATATFLLDLERMLESKDSANRVGDVCVQHFKISRTFEPYRPYLSKQDESQKMLQDCLRKSPGFTSFIESTKYQTTGIGNIGLRELLMEPVQRIPRYTLLWQAMVKCMAPFSDQRAKLLEASQIASRIARCEPDPHTIRATVMYCLERNVEGFPANFFSSSRDFIDCIDVDDVPVDTISPSPTSRLPGQPRPVSDASSSTPSLSSLTSASTASHGPTSPPRAQSSAVNPLHCTLFLFDDKMLVVKRQAGAISGRAVTGLDDVQKLVKTGGGVAVLDKSGARRDKLSFRGSVDIQDVIATDVGNGDFHLFFERPPMDQGDKWSGRAFRAMTAVQPPFFTALDPVALRRDKLRFLENLWAVQAVARRKMLPKDIKPSPLVLCSAGEIELDRTGDNFERATIFWNVCNRRNYLAQSPRGKVVVHIDEDGISPELELASSGPVMIIRLQPMAGGLCRFAVATAVDDDIERTVIEAADVPQRIANTIHRYGIFKFRTSYASAPATPSSTMHRLRPTMLNLDSISRNLFGSTSVSSRSQASEQNDIFGVSTTKRSGHSTRSSVSTRRSVDMRTNSSNESMGRSRHRSASPVAPSDHVQESSRSPYKEHSMGQSEIDLNDRLTLARNNSKSMAALGPTVKRGTLKLGSRSVAELRSDVGSAEAALRETLRNGEAASTARTPPLRIRNKTPSPTRSLAQPSPTRSVHPERGERAKESRLADMQSALLQTDIPVEEGTIEAVVVSPRATMPPQMPPSEGTLAAKSAPSAPARAPSIGPASPTRPGTAALSPRPMGPRSPTVRSTPGLGSMRTSISITSGAGRPVSPDREHVPLKDGSGGSPSLHPRPRIVSAKRQHSEDQFSPRKRSPSRSPLDLRAHAKDGDVPALPDPAPVPLLGRRRTSRQSSAGSRTPRKTSTPNTMPRALSVSNVSVDSAMSGDEDDSHDLSGTMDAIRRRIIESRSIAKKIRVEVENAQRQSLRESLSKSVNRLDRTPTLPRSPQRRDIKRLVDMDVNGQDVLARRGSIEQDSLVRDETARTMGTLLDKIDAQLKRALTDRDSAAGMLVELLRSSADHPVQVERLQSQVARAKDHQDLLRQQLADAQTEVDVMYEAFNLELDGMFSDAQLPETEAFQRLAEELKTTKTKRNELALENARLKRELEESNLKKKHLAEIAARGRAGG